MDKEYIRHKLPEEPPEGLISYARKEFRNEFGPDFCIFHSERVKIGPTVAEVLEHNDLRSRRSEWAAVCTCTDCGEDFLTQKEPGMDAIRMVVGEDDWYYTLEIGEPVDPYMGIQVQRSGDDMRCPLCGSKVRLIHKKELRGGRRKQLMVVEVRNIEGYTTILYWLVQREIEEWGLESWGAYPRDAYVLTERGSIVRYTHEQRTGWYAASCLLPCWKEMKSNQDSIDAPYPDWGSINNRKAGAVIWPRLPDLEGTTGEKTGLTEYLAADGYRPVAYLKWWRKFRNIENLCRQGQAYLVADIVSVASRYSYDVVREAEKYLNINAKRPHEMLNMSKADFRWLRANGKKLSTEIMGRWKEYTALGGKHNIRYFLMDMDVFTKNGLTSALQLMRQWPGTDLDKIEHYMRKQGLKPYESGILLDTRNALQSLYNGRPLTNEELWPSRLREAHDRYTQMLAERNSQEKSEKLRKGFAEVIDRYGELQWNDGELCVVLPKNNQDLIREGRILRHCVGGYGHDHVDGNSVIFFIRHYRRPERPYYTLAINMKRGARESQLHGYGNERHGPNKEYSHKIPAKVRAFCDRWENEILLPWYAEQQKNKEAKTT